MERVWLEWNLFRWIIMKKKKSTSIALLGAECLCAYGRKKMERENLSEKKNDFLFWNQICGTFLIQIIWVEKWWIYLLWLGLWCVSRHRHHHHLFLWSSLARRFYKNTGTLCINNRAKNLNILLSSLPLPLPLPICLCVCFIIFSLLHFISSAASFICILWNRNSKSAMTHKNNCSRSMCLTFSRSIEREYGSFPLLLLFSF